MRWMIGCVGLILWCSSATAYDPFSDDRIPPRFVIDAQENLRLVLKGNLVMSWRDLQGEGGDGRDARKAECDANPAMPLRRDGTQPSHANTKTCPAAKPSQTEGNAGEPASAFAGLLRQDG